MGKIDINFLKFYLNSKQLISLLLIDALKKQTTSFCFKIEYFL